MFFKIGFLKKFHNILKKTLVLESLFNNILQAFSSLPSFRDHHAYDKNNAG